MMENNKVDSDPRKHPASFRDPSGYIFMVGDQILRRVNSSYKENYQMFMHSGLYAALSDSAQIISHVELSDAELFRDYTIIQPDKIGYISYPYEWCFSQLKDAALLTLQIQKKAMDYGMSLKDASAYNIQFHRGKPIFIDTLSFEKYIEGKPWVAYRQFCQHFLAPLALMAKVDTRLSDLLVSNIDGVPLDLASKLLPLRTWASYSLLAHIHLHASSQKRYSATGVGATSTRKPSLTKFQLLALISSLLRAVNALVHKASATEWGNYYEQTNYSDQAMVQKEEIVRDMLRSCSTPSEQYVADYGANTGRFSRIAANEGFLVLAHDVDELAVEKNYQTAKTNGETEILPLVTDLTNPSPGIGWSNVERDSFIVRQRVSVGMALAIIHHLSISNNIPFEHVADLFSTICCHLIIEFVPKSDSQVKKLLNSRDDIFITYDQNSFELAFTKYFTIVDKKSVIGSGRMLYLMRGIKD